MLKMQIARDMGKPDGIVHKETVDQEIHLLEIYRAASRAYFQVSAIYFLNTFFCGFRAVMQLFVALDSEGLIQKSDPLYRSRETSFLRRFKPFQLLNFPAPLSFDDLKKNIDFAEFEVRLCRFAQK
jgi:hypothetical protein